MFKHGEEVNTELERATYSRMQAGERQVGITTVGQQQILFQASNKKFYVPTKQIERLATIAARNILKMVVETGETLTIGGKRLAPVDIEKSYDVRVEFKQVDPLIQMELSRESRENVKVGAISLETHRENMGMENEDEEVKRLLNQEVMKLPAVHEEMLALAVKQAGFTGLGDHMLEMLAAQRQQALMAARGQPASPGPSADGQGAPGAAGAETPMPGGGV